MGSNARQGISVPRGKMGPTDTLHLSNRPSRSAKQKPAKPIHWVRLIAASLGGLLVAGISGYALWSHKDYLLTELPANVVRVVQNGWESTASAIKGKTYQLGNAKAIAPLAEAVFPNQPLTGKQAAGALTPLYQQLQTGGAEQEQITEVTKLIAQYAQNPDNPVDIDALRTLLQDCETLFGDTGNMPDSAMNQYIASQLKRLDLGELHSPVMGLEGRIEEQIAVAELLETSPSAYTIKLIQLRNQLQGKNLDRAKFEAIYKEFIELGNHPRQASVASNSSDMGLLGMARDYTKPADPIKLLKQGEKPLSANSTTMMDELLDGDTLPNLDANDLYLHFDDAQKPNSPTVASFKQGLSKAEIDLKNALLASPVDANAVKEAYQCLGKYVMPLEALAVIRRANNDEPVKAALNERMMLKGFASLEDAFNTQEGQQMLVTLAAQLIQ
jgi:hypothetical protein